MVETKDALKEEGISELENQKCPICGENSLTMFEQAKEIPYFGKMWIFSMSCSACKYHTADIEADEQREPVKYTLEISSEEDMKIRVVKSSQATVKIPRIVSIVPGPASNGYVTNVEGILNRVKNQIEGQKNDEEERSDQKKIKSVLKKLTRVMWGQEKLMLIIEDPSGNSMIVSEKAVKGKL